MNTINTYKAAGIAIGIMIGLIIVVLFLRFSNKDHKLRTEYDEMQKVIRGDAYRIAFFTVMCFEGLMCVITAVTDIPMIPMVTHFLAIFIGVTVQAGYCIWKGAYIGLNTRMSHFIILMAIVSLFNLFIAYMAYREGRLIVDGKLQDQAVNLFCGLMFAILGIVGIIRKATDREVES